MDSYFVIGCVLQAFVAVWLAWTVWILPWETSEILALRRVGLALGATLRDRIVAAIWGKQ